MAVRTSRLPTSQESSCRCHIWLADGSSLAAELSRLCGVCNVYLTVSRCSKHGCACAGQPALDPSGVCSRTDPLLRMTWNCQRSLVSAADDYNLYTQSCFVTCHVMTLKVQRRSAVMWGTDVLTTVGKESCCVLSLAQSDSKHYVQVGECIKRSITLLC